MIKSIKVKGILLSLFLSVFFILVSGADVYGAELTYTGPDDDGTYIYSFGSGSFETNMTEGGTYELGYFLWDDNLSIVLMKNGQSMEYKNNDLIYINGSYVAVIYDVGSGELTSFSFEISNDLTGLGAGGDTGTDDIAGMDYDFTGDGQLGENGEYTDIQNSVDTLNSLQNMLTSFDSENIDSIDMDFYYSQETGNLVFTALGKEVLESSVPNNVTVNNAVYVKTLGVSQYIYKDGEIIQTPADNMYREPGYYDMVSFIYSDVTAEENEEDSVYVANTHFIFRILDENTSNVGVVNAPLGFHFNGIIFDGQPREIPEDNAFFLEEDGDYHVSYCADFDQNLVFTADIHRDTVAPFLEFNKNITGGVVTAPISYTCSEPGATVSLTIGGTSMDLPPDTEIYNGGYYVFKVTDNAGNVREYSFYVKAKYKFFSGGMIALLIAFVVLVGVYMLAMRHGDYKV